MHLLPLLVSRDFGSTLGCVCFRPLTLYREGRRVYTEQYCAVPSTSLSPCLRLPQASETMECAAIALRVRPHLDETP